MGLGKRGQLSIALIIGVLIATVSIYSFVAQHKAEPEFKNVVKLRGVENVYKYVESCLSHSSKKALYLAGMQGGYTYIEHNVADIMKSSDSKIKLSDLNMGEEIMKMPYVTTNNSLGDESLVPAIHFIDGNVVFPDTKRELEFYIQEKLLDCVDFEKIEQEGYEVTYENPVVNVTLLKNGTIIKSKFEMEFRKDGSIKSFEDFRVSYPIRLGYLQEAGLDLLLGQITDPEWAEISKMSEYPELDFRVISPRDDTLIYSIRDPKSSLENKNYYYIFATVTNFNGFENKEFIERFIER